MRPRSFVREVGVVFAMRLVLMVVVFLSDVAAARTLGPQGRGFLAILTLTPVLLATVCAGGLDAALNQLGHRESQSLSAVVNAAFRLGAAPVLASCIVLISGVGGVREWVFSGIPSRLVDEVDLAVLVIPGEALFVISGMLVMTRGSPVHFAWMRIVRRTIVLLGILASAAASAAMTDRLLVIMATWVFAALASGTLGLHWGRYRRNAGSAPAHAVFRIAAGAYPARVTDRLQSRISVLLVGGIVGGTGAGFLAVAVALAEMVLFVSNSTMTVLYSRNASSQPDTHRAALKGMFPVAIVLGLIIGTASQIALPAVYGEQFRPAILLTWILIPGAIATALIQTLMPSVIQRGRERLASTAQSIGMIVGLGIGVLSIPHYGVIGGAIAHSTAYVLTFVLLVTGSASAEGLPLRMMLLPSRGELSGVRTSLKQKLGGGCR